MLTLSTDYAKKLKAIRNAEKLTQAQFSDLTGLSLGFIKQYESGHRLARAEAMEAVLMAGRFKKYTMWLMHNETLPAAGQIAPALSLDGAEEQVDAQDSTGTIRKLPRSRRNAG
ncbi:helix-turn-helix transcriptional regulator [Salmonella enterica subsp. enterica]|uniref:XRE family transcriptional regulator n=1 Tax=Salmonella enterica subsp. enterica serovar Kisarawe TaxID=2517242 RepID=A0A5X8YZC0_SALET|nr:XRE family transcriptional regulator [Salmonella enterica]EBQ8818808.1 XRE family transcriptional regulator [Salmonella enterica subsp. enterica serovar Kisarawe]EDS6472309.1 helix-turn-helix transcriptional regulator [Salmonella enterica subsp. enterica]EDU6184684.1 helix-turn-helix transcriptional regulator [Salmonella enterica subsp. houtenae serovar 44:z4,z23:-]EBT7936860.1 helix-turn-helix transcriptional regulator [Salmonella enterica]